MLKINMNELLYLSIKNNFIRNEKRKHFFINNYYYILDSKLAFSMNEYNIEIPSIEEAIAQPINELSTGNITINFMNDTLVEVFSSEVKTLNFKAKKITILDSKVDFIRAEKVEFINSEEEPTEFSLKNSTVYINAKELNFNHTNIILNNSELYIEGAIKDSPQIKFFALNNFCKVVLNDKTLFISEELCE